MIEFAYVQCGLSIDEFYNLSLYEWSLEVLRVKNKIKAENTKWESHAVLVREFMALMANINRNPKKVPTPYKSTDFIRLSFDEPDDKPKMLSNEELENRIAKVEKIKHKLIKKKNG